MEWNGMEWNGMEWNQLFRKIGDGGAFSAEKEVLFCVKDVLFCGKELKDIFFVYYENVCSHFLLFRAEGVKCLQINTLFTNQFSSQKY
jgi:hypothetical protein